MAYVGRIDAPATNPVSPLMLSDHLLRLAEATDGAGFRAIAEDLLALADRVLDRPRAERTRLHHG
ncbi:MAG: hypothetical protein KGL52_00085 [Rhodospirillales bacterium]|jgi:hypothetical protein|nr:hypothetical protein [Rhodospirillales bacterium]